MFKTQDLTFKQGKDNDIILHVNLNITDQLKKKELVITVFFFWFFFITIF